MTYPRPKRNFTENETKEIIQQYLSGKTLEVIAKKFNCSRNPIRRVLMDNETPKRKKHDLLIAVVKDDKKLCSKCKNWLPLDDFYVQSKRPCGRTSRCRKCHDAYAKENYDAAIRRNYGISMKDYQHLLELQNGVCAICKTTETIGRGGQQTRLVVDHNHQTGQLRGLLCHKCNKALGQLNDNADLFDAAANYLRHHEIKEGSICLH